MKYAVGYTSFFDNEIKVSIVNAETSQEAMIKTIQSDPNFGYFLNWGDLLELANNREDPIEYLKRHFVNGEIGISTPIPIE